MAAGALDGIAFATGTLLCIGKIGTGLMPIFLLIQYIAPAPMIMPKKTFMVYYLRARISVLRFCIALLF